MFVAHLEAELRGRQGWSVAQVLDADYAGAILLGAFDVDEVLVGYVVAQSVLDEAELHIIGVDKLHQRQGLAGRMLDALVGTLEDRGVVRLYLEVAKNNLAAIGLYEKCGFKVVGERKAYYKNDDGSMDDALVMQVLLQKYLYQKC